MKRLGIVATILALVLFLVNSVSAVETVTSVTPLTAQEDSAYTGTLTLNGTANGTLTYVLAAGAPTWLSINANTGALSGTPLQADVGINTFSIDIIDAGDSSNTTSGPFTITVSAVNDAPILDVTNCTANGVEDEQYTCTVAATDEDDTVLTFSLTTKPDGMTIDSSTGAITWTPDDEDVGSHTVTVLVKDDETPTYASDTESFSIFVRPNDVCGDYTSGSDVKISDWDITDDDEDFYPGDNLEMEVKVENDGNEDLEDIVVEAILYDATDGKKLDVVKSDEFDLDEDEDETVEVILEIPSDIDTDNDLIVFVSAYEDGNDDDNCAWDKNINLDFKRRKHDVSIDKVRVTPEIVKAGSNIEVKVDVENVGDRDENDVYIKVRQGVLGIEKKSELFDVDAYEAGDDDEYTTTIVVKIPEDAQSGDYDLEINVYDEDDEIYESGEAFVTVTVDGKTSSSGTSSSSDSGGEFGGSVSLSTEGTPKEVEAGKPISIPVKLTNTADETRTYKITVSNIADWADSTSEFEAFLTAGQSSTYYVTIHPKKDATEGKHSATINVKSGSSVIATKTLSFTVPAKSATTSGSTITGGAVADVDGTETRESAEEEGFFSKIFSGTTLWIISDLVLVVIAIFFIKMLFSKRN